jgi:polyhydroxybutyrate depolymerase
VELATLTVGTLLRRFRVYRPAAVGARPGLILVLHWADGTGEKAEELTGFDREADRLGWIVTYPDAVNPGPSGGWETFACCSQPGVDDIAFVANIIDRLKVTDAVDADRVFVTGMSRGGMMAYRLGCELADRIAAIAPVAGNMADANGSVEAVPSRPSRPVSLLAIHGTSDRVVPIEGGVSLEDVGAIAYAPLSEVLRKWRVFCKCHPHEVVEAHGPVTVRRWDAPNGACVELRLVTGGRHAWPGPSNPANSPDASFVASRVIADFFAGHSRPRTSDAGHRGPS